MFVVNAGPGFKKMLWPAAQKFLDPKTISKIQVNGLNLSLNMILHSFFFLNLQLTGSIFIWLISGAGAQILI